MNKRMNAATALLLGSVASGAPAEEGLPISAECRGIAAGTVAAMRAAGELDGADAAQAAIVAARRACAAAFAEFSQSATTDATPSSAQLAAQTAETDDATAQSSEASEDDEPSIWELLSRDRDLKPGHNRLRRLKTQ